MQMTWALRALVGALALVGTAEAAEHEGFFLGLGLGGAEGNFSVDNAKEADVGTYFELTLGNAWSNGFGLSGGVSVNAYAYEVQAFGERITDLTLTFVTVDASAWYFLPVSDDVELTLRAGLGSTQATTQLGNIKAQDDSVGLHLGFGADFFVGETFALQTELFYRTYGVAFAVTEDEEVTAAGLQLGVRWR